MSDSRFFRKYSDIIAEAEGMDPVAAAQENLKRAQENKKNVEAQLAALTQQKQDADAQVAAANQAVQQAQQQAQQQARQPQQPTGTASTLAAPTGGPATMPTMPQ